MSGKKIRKKTYVTKTVSAHPRERHNLTHGEFSEIQSLLFSLEKLSQHLVTESNIADILTEIMKTLGRTLGAVWVNVWELTPDKKAVYIRQGYGKPGTETYIEHSKKVPLKLGTAFIGRAMKTKKTWSSSDMWVDPHLPRTWVKRVKEQNFRAIVCTPQIVESAKVVGGMCVYFDKPRVISDLEMRLITVASNQIAVAVLNAENYQQLLAERDKTLSMINSLNEGVILYDNDLRIIMMNPKAEEILWVRGHDLTGKQLSTKDAQRSVLLKNVYQISNLTQAEFEMKEIQTEGPHAVILEVILIPVYEANRRKIGSLRILRDITREREVELLKAGFIATASHQMRTPLTEVRWGLDALLRGEEGELNQNQREFVKKIFTAATSLIGLLKDLMNTARVEEGNLGYEFKITDVSPAIHDAIATVSAEAKERNIELILKDREEPLPKVKIDHKNLNMALQNILDNAIRYSSPGQTVKILVSAVGENLVISFEDRGIGIPQKDQKFIFIKFYRAPNAQLYQTEGSGLGLYIAKKIVEKHNGSILFESAEGKGTKFSVYLPTNPHKMPTSMGEILAPAPPEEKTRQ